MTKSVKKVLKAHLRKNLKFAKIEFRKMNALGSRYHIRRDRVFKAAVSNIRKEIRLFSRLNKKL